ncbi:MAG TPA: hypothetical protein VFQ54_13830, partial [Thermomicrobiales bacterium]|nr:hypothetical protein [Thermomicrobiales bacterium]
TISTGDGGDVPDSAQVCVGDVCQTVGASVSSAAVSPATLTFGDLAPGIYDVTVTNAAPYQNSAGSIAITAGETTTSDIVLQVAAVTVAPTRPGNATPITTVTVAPTNPSSGGDGGGGSAPSNPGAPSGGTTVRALPNTGSGSSGSNGSLLLLLSALAITGLGGWAAIRRRRNP